jgi:hypothetical protein
VADSQETSGERGWEFLHEAAVLVVIIVVVVLVVLLLVLGGRLGALPLGSGGLPPAAPSPRTAAPVTRGTLNVSLHVEGEMIAAREATVAVPALEGLGSGVFAIVAREFVRAGESPLAALPAALVRLFSWKNIKGHAPVRL